MNSTQNKSQISASLHGLVSLTQVHTTSVLKHINNLLLWTEFKSSLSTVPRFSWQQKQTNKRNGCHSWLSSAAGSHFSHIQLMFVAFRQACQKASPSTAMGAKLRTKKRASHSTHNNFSHHARQFGGNGFLLADSEISVCAFICFAGQCESAKVVWSITI